MALGRLIGIASIVVGIVDVSIGGHCCVSIVSASIEDWRWFWASKAALARPQVCLIWLFCALEGRGLFAWGLRRHAE